MHSRRDFLSGAATGTAGVLFTGCDLVNARHAHAQPVQRREVVVNGRRVKTVDIHSHCAFPEANALMGLKVNPESLVMSAERIRQMDAQGIDVEALSINPFWYKAERDVAEKLIKLQNEKLAELCAAQPDRFVAFATVAMQYPDLAVQQLEDGVKKLGLRGVGIAGHAGGEVPSSAKYDPFWTKVQDLGVPVFVHPGGADNIIKQGALGGRGDRRDLALRKPGPAAESPHGPRGRGFGRVSPRGGRRGNFLWRRQP